MSPTTFRFNLPVDITEESIRALLLDLQDKGLLYHIDDSPFEVITSVTGERTFSDEEAYALHGFWDMAKAIFFWDDIWDLYPEVSL